MDSAAEMDIDSVNDMDKNMDTDMGLDTNMSMDTHLDIDTDNRLWHKYEKDLCWDVIVTSSAALPLRKGSEVYDNHLVKIAVIHDYR